MAENHEIIVEDKMNIQDELEVLPEIESEQEEVVQSEEEVDKPKKEYTARELETLLPNLNKTIRQTTEMMKMSETMWLNTKAQYKFTDEHVKKLYDFNQHHLISEEDWLKEKNKPVEENTEEVKDEETPSEETVNKNNEEHDEINGLDKLTEDDFRTIFEDHPFIKVDDETFVLEVAIDTIKEAYSMFHTWIVSVARFKSIHKQYNSLMDDLEDLKIAEMKDLIDKTEDPELKVKYQTGFDSYMSLKYLDFIKDELTEKFMEQLCKVYSDETKLNYIMKRGKDKLEQMNLPAEFMMIFYDFEKRFLDEKYHCNNNILLLFFLNFVVYNNSMDEKSYSVKKYAMAMTFDKFARNELNEEIKSKVLENVVYLEEQFLGKLGNSKLAEKISIES